MKPIIFALSGYKNSGKTTLMVAVVKELTARGYRVATIKHDGHDFAPDVPNTDSWRHRQAGAYAAAIFSSKRFLVTKECDDIDEQQLIPFFPEADIILIEGCKHSPYPKYFCRYPEDALISASALADKILSMGEG